MELKTIIPLKQNQHLKTKQIKSSYDEVKSVFPYMETKEIIEALKTNENNAINTIDYLFNKDSLDTIQKTGLHGKRMIEEEGNPVKSENFQEKNMKINKLIKEIKSEIENETGKKENNLKSKYERAEKIETILLNSLLDNKEDCWKRKFNDEYEKMKENKKTCSVMLKSYKSNKQICDTNDELNLKKKELQKEIDLLINEKSSLEALELVLSKYNQ